MIVESGSSKTGSDFPVTGKGNSKGKMGSSFSGLLKKNQEQKQTDQAAAKGDSKDSVKWVPSKPEPKQSAELGQAGSINSVEPSVDGSEANLLNPKRPVGTGSNQGAVENSNDKKQSKRLAKRNVKIEKNSNEAEAVGGQADGAKIKQQPTAVNSPKLTRGDVVFGALTSLVERQKANKTGGDAVSKLKSSDTKTVKNTLGTKELSNETTSVSTEPVKNNRRIQSQTVRRDAKPVSKALISNLPLANKGEKGDVSNHSTTNNSKHTKGNEHIRNGDHSASQLGNQVKRSRSRSGINIDSQKPGTTERSADVMVRQVGDSKPSRSQVLPVVQTAKPVAKETELETSISAPERKIFIAEKHLIADKGQNPSSQKSDKNQATQSNLPKEPNTPSPSQPDKNQGPQTERGISKPNFLMGSSDTKSSIEAEKRSLALPESVLPETESKKPKPIDAKDARENRSSLKPNFTPPSPKTSAASAIPTITSEIVKQEGVTQVVEKIAIPIKAIESDKKNQNPKNRPQLVERKGQLDERPVSVKHNETSKSDASGGADQLVRQTSRKAIDRSQVIVNQLVGASRIIETIPTKRPATKQSGLAKRLIGRLPAGALGQAKPETGGMEAAFKGGDMMLAQEEAMNGNPQKQSLFFGDRSAFRKPIEKPLSVSPEFSNSIQADTQSNREVSVRSDMVNRLTQAGSELESVQSKLTFTRGAAVSTAIMYREIMSAVESFRSMSNSRWSINLEPVENLRMQLELRMADSQLVVQTRVDRAGHAMLQSGWSELQQLLAEKEVDLKSLTTQSQKDGAGTKFENQGGRQSGEQKEQDESRLSRELAEMLADFEKETQQPRKATRRNRKPRMAEATFESWA